MKSIVAWMFCGYVVMLPIVRPFSHAFDRVLIQYADVFFLLIFLLWIGAVLNSRIELPASPLLYAIAFLLMAFIISTVFSSQPSKSLLKMIGIVYLAAIAMVAMSISDEAVIFRRIVICWLIGTIVVITGTIVGLAGFVFGFDEKSSNFFLSHYGSLPTGNYPRIRSFFENANMTTNYLNVSLLMVLLAHTLGFLNKTLTILLVAGISVAAFFTLSPGIGGLILSASLWIWATRSKISTRIRNSALIFGSLLAVFIFFSTIISPASIFREGGEVRPINEWQVQPSVRLKVWNNSIDRAFENPLVGRGTGTDAAKVYYKTISGQGQSIRDAHNAWLNVFGQTGCLGLAAFLFLSFSVWRLLRFQFPNVGESENIVIALSCAVAGSFFYQNLFGSYEDARHLWLLFGMLAAFATARGRIGA